MHKRVAMIIQYMPLKWTGCNFVLSIDTYHEDVESDQFGAFITFSNHHHQDYMKWPQMSGTEQKSVTESEICF